jgi:hypothetical protein
MRLAAMDTGDADPQPSWSANDQAGMVQAAATVPAWPY